MSRFPTGTMVLVATGCMMLAVAAALPQAAGSAQASKTPQKPTFQSLDKDADGRVSLDEAAENDAVFVAFEGLDKNRDGQLTREEFAAFRRERER